MSHNLTKELLRIRLMFIQDGDTMVDPVSVGAPLGENRMSIADWKADNEHLKLMLDMSK